MTRDDFAAFTVAWGAAAEMQTGKALSDRAIKMAYLMLEELELQEVKEGLRAHCRKDRWVPTPSDILAYVYGVLPTNTALYGLAVDDTTILGRYIKSQMHGDLSRLSERDGLRRTEMIRSKVGQFCERALIGDYTERELRMFLAAGHNPAGELAPDVSGPRQPYRQAVTARCAEIEPEEQIEHKEAERTPEQIAAGKAEIAKLMSTLSIGGQP